MSARSTANAACTNTESWPYASWFAGAARRSATSFCTMNTARTICFETTVAISMSRPVI